MKAIAILLTMLILPLLGLLTRTVSNAALHTHNQSEGTPLFLPHLHKGFPATTTPTPTFDPSRLPDLEPYDYGFGYDNPCPWGSSGKAWAWVRNSGEGDAGPFSIRVYIDNSTVAAVSGLAASATVEVTLSFWHGPVSFVLIDADYYHEVRESDEANNHFQIAYTAPPPCTPVPTVTPSPT